MKSCNHNLLTYKYVQLPTYRSVQKIFENIDCLLTKSTADYINYFVRMYVTVGFLTFNSEMQICKKNRRNSNHFDN